MVEANLGSLFYLLHPYPGLLLPVLGLAVARFVVLISGFCLPHPWVCQLLGQFTNSWCRWFCLPHPRVCWGQDRGWQLPHQVARFIILIHRMMQVYFLFLPINASPEIYTRDIHFLFPIILFVSKTEPNWIFFSLCESNCHPPIYCVYQLFKHLYWLRRASM